MVSYCWKERIKIIKKYRIKKQIEETWWNTKNIWPKRRQKKRNTVTKTWRNKWKTSSKTLNLRPTTSLITLEVNILHTPIKSWRCQKRCQKPICILSIREIYHANTEQRTRCGYIMSDNVAFKTELITKDTEGHFMRFLKGQLINKI